MFNTDNDGETDIYAQRYLLKSSRAAILKER